MGSICIAHIIVPKVEAGEWPIVPKVERGEQRVKAKLNCIPCFYTLEYDVTRRDPLSVVMVCWFTYSQFHSRRYSLRITLKYTTLVRMRSGSAWTGIHDNGAEVMNGLQ